VVRQPQATPLRNDPEAILRRTRDLRHIFDRDPELFGRSYLPIFIDETGGSVFAVTADRLRETFLRVVNEFRSRYVLFYTPQGVATTGWHKVEVTLRGQRANIQARRGYIR
jgi:hypothetical protein